MIDKRQNLSSSHSNVMVAHLEKSSNGSIRSQITLKGVPSSSDSTNSATTISMVFARTCSSFRVQALMVSRQQILNHAVMYKPSLFSCRAVLII
ncbi:hypothetical protein L6164_007962 [Bauhinia variegata]|nr:hypothetical protein L6164_007962 [Bauhinia variegata]